MKRTIKFLLSVSIFVAACDEQRKDFATSAAPSIPTSLPPLDDDPPEETPDLTSGLSPSNPTVIAGPDVTAFSLVDPVTGFPQFSNSDAAIASATAPAGATAYCFKDSSAAPAADDACWGAASSRVHPIKAATVNTVYAWARNAEGRISANPLFATIEQRAFNNFAGLAEITLENQGGRHLGLKWTAEPVPWGYDRVHVYVATTTGAQDFSQPTYVIPDYSNRQISIGGLEDGSNYCVVVRAAKAGAYEEKNIAEHCLTTRAALTVANAFSEVPARVLSYFNFSRDTVAPGEVFTLMGKRDSGEWTYPTVQHAMGYTFPDNTFILAGPNGYTFFAMVSQNSIYRISPDRSIQRIVGTGTAGFSGDGGPAAAAQLNQPYRMTLDNNGNLYIMDYGNARLRKIDAAGNISTFAGNGSLGTAGDGGPATSAQIEGGPVVCDSAGNIYFGWNHTVRVVAPNGIITKFAGTTNGDSGDGGLATVAQIKGVNGLAVDSADNVYISDNGSNKIRKVAAGTGIITTFAGTGTAGYSGNDGPALAAQIRPFGLSIDSSDNLYFHETGYVRKISPAGIISAVAGKPSGTTAEGQLATQVKLPSITYVSVTSDDEILIQDLGRMLKIDKNTGILTRVAGAGQTLAGGSALSYRLTTSVGTTYGMLGVADGVLIADVEKHVVWKLRSDGNLSVFAGQLEIGGTTGDGGLATAAKLYSPTSLAKDSAGNIYVSSLQPARIRKIASNGIITLAGGTSTTVASPDGTSFATASLGYIYGMAFDKNDRLYFNEGNRVRYVDAQGKIQTLAGDATSAFSGDGGPAASARFNILTGLKIDSKGDILVADLGNNRIRKITMQTGIVQTLVGNGSVGGAGDGGAPDQAELGGVVGFYLAPDDSLYLPVTGSHLIRQVKNGVISTFGSSSPNCNVFSDGRPLAQVTFCSPSAIEVQANGDIFVYDGLFKSLRVVKSSIW